MRKLSILFAAGSVAVMASCTQPKEEKETNEEVVEKVDTTYNFVEGHAPVWAEATAQVVELVEAMPEEMYSYKPNDSSMTFAEQIVHIAGSSKTIANLLLKGEKPGDKPDMDIAAMGKEDLKELVNKRLGETWDIMKTMSDQELLEKTKSFSGNEMTKLEGLLMVHDHLTNHKAKANLYIRVSGNEPPNYRYY
jgi:uncharacterized damage-inducible protein DinB